MKITVPCNVNRKKIYTAVATVVSAASVLTGNRKSSSKNNITYDKDFGIWGRAASAEFMATQNISKINGLNLKPNVEISVITGSSGVGKDAILRKFLEKHPEYKLSISHTTRKQRPGEIDGKDYYFVNDEEFQFGIENGEFLEWEDFAGNKYGTKKATVNYMLEKTNHLILKLDTKGALKIKKMIPQAKLIFVAPPSIKELEARLRGRGTESEDAIQRRLSAVKTEMKNAEKFDYQIVNDTIDNAVSSLEGILVKKPD